ncbi:neuroguidin isoform X1 [Microcaecilia unicolor]|uniref:Neuroguidin-like isoform X1 n=1 Tax=Microcaecilia unicolor TaxID=1415580 RepID=A0A6P7YSL2_9AMPH|nr:neuroguidin-like isoform X1 [Microcaecilia unicolor]
MPDQERVVEDLPATLKLLSILQDQVVGTTAHVQSLLQKVRAGVFPTEKGLSFLELKDQLLLMYLMDIAYLILEKTSGKSLKEHSSLLRLVETRTVLEKMRPIDQKLKYQIDKLVKAAVTGSLDESDPLRFKPNPDNLISKLSESEEEEKVESGGAKDSGKKNPGKIRKYVPPRLAPVHFDETEAERERKILERAKKRALSSSVIRELKEQYSDAPEEIREGRGFHMMRQSQEEQRRTSYEESMMVRLNLTRKEKAQKKRSMAMTSQLQSLTHFGDISALMGGAGNPGEDFVPPVKRSKKTLKQRKKKKGFRRRR